MKILYGMLLLTSCMLAMELEESHKRLIHTELPLLRQMQENLNEKKERMAKELLDMYSVQDKWTIGCCGVLASLVSWGAGACHTDPIAHFAFQLTGILVATAGFTLILQSCAKEE